MYSTPHKCTFIQIYIHIQFSMKVCFYSVLFYAICGFNDTSASELFLHLRTAIWSHYSTQCLGGAITVLHCCVFSDCQGNPWLDENLSHGNNPCGAQTTLFPPRDDDAFHLSHPFTPRTIQLHNCYYTCHFF